MDRDVLYPLRRLHGMLYEWCLRFKKRKTLHEWYLYRKERKSLKASYVPKIKRFFSENPQGVFLVFTPEHSNMGDHAIALAEAELLKKAGVSYFEITGRQLEDLEKYNLIKILNGYPIVVQGGGYLGTIWFHSERILRKILRDCLGSTLLLFPNTIYYDDSEWGRQELKKSIRIYNRHKNLRLYAREEISYEAMRKIYKNVKLVPDVVLSLDKSSSDEALRKGCMICLRGDCEKTRTDEEELEIMKHVQTMFGERYWHSDMCLDHSVSVTDREKELERKFAEFRSAELVITDRLHGMIFAAITGTPCIVINSKSPKVRGCYRWIEELEYIWFAESVKDIIRIYEGIPKKQYRYDVERLLPYYDQLMQELMLVAAKKG